MIIQSLLLKRAADALETFYTFPRPVNQPGSLGPVNHISPGPIYYPKSPAIFTPAILTPGQFTQSRINAGIAFSQDKHSGGHVTGAAGCTTIITINNRWRVTSWTLARAVVRAP